jgi:hypothetical protein
VLVGSGLALSRSSDARRDPSRERDLAAGPETPRGSQGPGQAAGWGAGA